MHLKKHRIRDFLFFSSGIFPVNLFIGIAYYTIQGDFFAGGYFLLALSLLNGAAFLTQLKQRPVIATGVMYQPAKYYICIVFPSFLFLEILYAAQLISIGAFTGIFVFLNLFSGLLLTAPLEQANGWLTDLVNKFLLKSFSGIRPVGLPLTAVSHRSLHTMTTGKTTMPLPQHIVYSASGSNLQQDALEQEGYAGVLKVSGNMDLTQTAVVIPFDNASDIPACNRDFNKIIKRSFDIVFSLLVIILLLSWLFPVIGLLIKLESPGPVFFRQKRSGLNNKPFWCYKFRSMKVNDLSDEQQASRNDNRITRMGSFLRRTSLDELPQFLNVLAGNMSVVGPRPHMLKHTEYYGALIPDYMHRLKVKQGVTGLAQVNGYRGETSDLSLMQARVAYDNHYVNNWSFLLDCKIIVKTVIVTLRPGGDVF